MKIGKRNQVLHETLELFKLEKQLVKKNKINPVITGKLQDTIQAQNADIHSQSKKDLVEAQIF